MWMNEIIKKCHLPFESVEQEVKMSTSGGPRRYPDLIVWYKKPDKIACLIELKVPTVDVYSDDLVNDALQKATLAGIPFSRATSFNFPLRSSRQLTDPLEYPQELLRTPVAHYSPDDAAIRVQEEVRGGPWHHVE